MVRYENDCVDCEAPGYPCMGSACRLRHYPHYYCDHCGEEVDKLYWYENNQLCMFCVLDELEVVESNG